MSEKYGVTFFQPGQIVFHVAGEADIDSLIEWAYPICEEQDWQIKRLPPGEEVPFSGSAGHSEGMYGTESLSKKSAQSRPYIPPPYEKKGPFTLVPATVTGIENEKDMDQLLDLILHLDAMRKDAQDAHGIPLQLVSPNWLMSAVRSDPGGTGGPGGRPVQYNGKLDTSEHLFIFGEQVKNDKGGEGIVVAVLDTAPSPSLDEIYKRWVKNVPEENEREEMLEHSLLTTLLDENDRHLTVIGIEGENQESDTSSDDNGTNSSDEIQLEDHDYPMSDHGLFVAGIIHSLAPKADIRLIPVLNQFGVGDLMGIAHGLKQVIEFSPKEDQNKNLVVNMSLTLQFPLEEAHIGTDDPKGKELGMKILDQRRPWCVDLLCVLINWFCKVIYDRFHIQLPGCEESWFERQALPLLSICRSVNFLGSDIIAAAGNKGKEHYRPRAEYPAAFRGVWGVGALPKNPIQPQSPCTRLEAASYSNYSDRPRVSGIATLGGEKDEDGDTDTGILGIYVGSFPKKIPGTDEWVYEPSTNGWAYWCGTSFATAIITGLTANMLSKMPSSATPHEAIQILLKDQRFRTQRYRTKEFERVLFVTQGPRS